MELPLLEQQIVEVVVAVLLNTMEEQVQMVLPVVQVTVL